MSTPSSSIVFVGTRCPCPVVHSASYEEKTTEFEVARRRMKIVFEVSFCGDELSFTGKLISGWESTEHANNASLTIECDNSEKPFEREVKAHAEA